MKQLHAKLKDFLESGVAAEEVAARQALLMSIEQISANNAEEDRTLDVTNKLRRMGMSSSNEAENLMERLPETPEAFATEELRRDMNADIIAYSALESIAKVCMDIHRVDIVSGNTKLSIALQGFDIFEFIPSVPSIMEIKTAVQQRRKALLEKKSSRAKKATASMENT